MKLLSTGVYSVLHLGWNLEVASNVFRCGCVLEHVGCGCIRFHDQSTDLAVLHPRLEHHSVARSRCFVWCLWLLGAGLYSADPALYPSRKPAKREADENRLLGVERWLGADDFDQRDADRYSAVLRQRHSRVVVCPQ